MTHNFNLICKEDLNEISSKAFLYRHKTGAELIHIKNNDNNKVFCISFKTLPENNTGVFHILEHCVLCGSKKYAMKDPFGELSKGTLNTYLNAMTFRDKTMYPVAGTNEKDFFKMTDVYLDAVFFPLIYEKKEIMLQEGVNFHLDESGNVTGYGGIVFNEMSGSFAEPDEYLKHRVYEKLFMNSKYMYDSGGFPDEIPSITYEYLLSRHKEYYRPSNAFLYLYGDMDIEKYLCHIDNNYLSHFEPSRVYETPKFNLPIEPINFEITGKTDKSYGLTSICANYENNPKLITGLFVLCRYLFRMEGSPVKMLVLDEKLGDDITDFLDLHLPKTVLNITVKNCVSIKRVNERIFKIVDEIVKNGFDKELLDSSIQSLEFQIKEENYGHRPKGLQYLITMSTRWLYGENPFELLKRKKILEEIKNDTEYLKNLLSKFFLNNNAVVSGFMTTGVEKKQVLIKNPETNAAKDNEALARYQKEYENEQILSKIPMLALTDIEKKSEILPFEMNPDLKTSRTELDTNGITYMNFLFDIDESSGLNINLSLLSYLLGKLDTKNYKFFELSKKISANLGGISFSHHCFSSVKNKSFKPKFVVSVKTLDENINKAFEYTKEIILNTLFSDEKRIESLINEYKSQLYSRIISRGHLWALSYAAAHLHPTDMFDETVSGITFYNHLKSLNNTESLCEELKQLFLSIFNRDSFSFHFTSKNRLTEKFISDFYDCLPNNKKIISTKNISSIKPNKRFITETPVYFNALSFDYKVNRFDYDGSMNVLANILNNQFLMQKIRLEGGAYGFGGSFNRRGLANFYSYRDPNLEKTFDIFNSMKNFVMNINLSERQITQYIIGAINSLDKPKQPNVKGLLALTRYLCNITDEDIKRERSEILSTSLKKLKNFNSMLVIKTENSGMCSFGGNDVKSPLLPDGYKIT